MGLFCKIPALVSMADIVRAKRYFHVFGDEEWNNTLNSKPPTYDNPSATQQITTREAKQ
jgi:hypothetical protein